MISFRSSFFIRLYILVGLFISKTFSQFTVPHSVITELSELPLDEYNRLASHWLLYSNNENCRRSIEGIFNRPNNDFRFRNIAPVDGNAAAILFNTATDESTTCFQACLERGTLHNHLGYVLEKNLHNSTSNLSEFITKECQAAEVGFILHGEETAEIYWINKDLERVRLMDLKLGEQNTIWQQTYLGHRFEVIGKNSKKLLLSLLVEYNGIYVIGQYQYREVIRNPIDAIKTTLDHEWGRSRRVTRTFTDVGFSIGQLPLDLYASMSAYYHNNRNHLTLEEWDSKGVFVNWWEAPVYMIGMPWGLKRYWQSRLKVLVEEWSGQELELTDIYGMRQYTDGARLLTHVDREETHAASLIVNIAQSEIRSPWHVEIYDFADRLHEVEMHPGDIVYYESARCLHGRMKPLDGSFYVNLFAHYRPKGGDSKWYSKTNPSDAPERLLDIGECRVEKNIVSCTKGRKLPFLNKDLEKLNGPLDLFQYWKKVSPNATSSSSQAKESETRTNIDFSSGEL